MNSNLITHSSPDYNWVFDKKTGAFARWGKTEEDDAVYSDVGPEILDIEVSDVCSQGCSHCYKSNTKNGKNMSFDTFKTILDKMPQNLTQVAFGVGDIDANRDLFKMFSYCRDRDVVPNVTINGDRLSFDIIAKLVQYCGAVAVSNYNKDTCYNAVLMLKRFGLAQVNIHQLLSAETLDKCYEVVTDARKDPRLLQLGAIVFLTLKPKGKRNSYKSVSGKEYKDFVKFLMQSKVSFGFDSCAANNFVKSSNDRKYDIFAEACESCLFSSYVNVDGDFFPCSFAEGEEGYKGVSVLKAEDFLNDVWYANSTKAFRDKLLGEGRNCPIFNLKLF